MKCTIGYSAAGHLFVQVGDEQVGAAVVGREVMPLDDVGVNVRRDPHLNLRWSIRPKYLATKPCCANDASARVSDRSLSPLRYVIAKPF